MGPSAEYGHAGRHGRWHGQRIGARALHTETQTPGSDRAQPGPIPTHTCSAGSQDPKVHLKL